MGTFWIHQKSWTLQAMPLKFLVSWPFIIKESLRGFSSKFKPSRCYCMCFIREFYNISGWSLSWTTKVFHDGIFHYLQLFIYPSNFVDQHKWSYIIYSCSPSVYSWCFPNTWKVFNCSILGWCWHKRNWKCLL